MDADSSPDLSMTMDPVLDLEWSWASLQGNHGENDDFGNGALFGNYGGFAVCDGLGGHRGGALAARSLVACLLERLPDYLPSEPEEAARMLDAEVKAAARRMRQLVRNAAPDAQPHTTLVVACVSAELTISAHVGDSRFYLIRDGAVAWRSKDHSVARLLADGAVPGSAPGEGDSKRLYRVLTGEEYTPACIEILKPLRAAEAIILCTDGYWGSADEAALAALARSADLKKASRDALDSARCRCDEDSRDDASLMIIRRRGAA